MFHFIPTIFNKLISGVASVIIAVGIVQVPPIPNAPLQVNKKINSPAVLGEQTSTDPQIENLKKQIEELKKQQEVSRNQNTNKPKTQNPKSQADTFTTSPNPPLSPPPSNVQQLQQAEKDRLAQEQRQQEVERQLQLEKALKLQVEQKERERLQQFAHQQELELAKQLYQKKLQELEVFIAQINQINSRKIAEEQELRSQESQFIITYCNRKEEELSNNYASRGLTFSGARQKAIADLKITCPTEAKNIFSASTNDALYPFIVQLDNMKRQFQQYNQQLYSSCNQHNFNNCSVYMDAAFPIR